MEEFPYKRRGDKKRAEHTTRCLSCTEKDADRKRRMKEANKENDESPTPFPRAEKLPVTSMEDFLTSLRRHNGDIDVEARVVITSPLSCLRDLECKGRADAISQEVWECTRYRFTCVLRDWIL